MGRIFERICGLRRRSSSIRECCRRLWSSRTRQPVLPFLHSLHAVRIIPSAIDACTNTIDKTKNTCNFHNSVSHTPYRRLSSTHAHRSYRSATERRHTTLHRLSNTEEAALSMLHHDLQESRPDIPTPVVAPNADIHPTQHHIICHRRYRRSLCIAP